MADITTAGWDTVFALRLSHLNGLIQNSIDSGDLVLPAIEWWPPGGDGIWAPLIGLKFVGDAGLSGSKAKVAFSVGPATLRYHGMFCDPGAVTVVGLLDLRRIDEPRFVTISAVPATDFQVLHIDGPTLPSSLQVVYKLYFQKAVSLCLADFKPVLARIDLQSNLPQTARWLAPVAVGHCVSGGVDAKGDADAGSALAILCMTEPFVPGNATPPPSFDCAVIPESVQAAFLISGSKFTRNLLFNGLAQALFTPGRPLTADQLAEIKRDRLQIIGPDQAKVISMKPGSPPISLATVNVDVSPLYAVFAESLLLPVTVPAALAALVATLAAELITTGKANIVLPVPVQVESLDVQRNDETISFKMGVQCEVNFGKINIAVVTMSVSSSYKLTFSQGKFQFVRDGDPFVSKKIVTLPDWIGTSETVAAIIATILGVIVTIVTDGQALALIGVSLALIEGEIQATPQLISKAVADGVGVAVPASLEDFVATAVSPVAWLQATSFKADSLALGDAILFAGAMS